MLSIRLVGAVMALLVSSSSLMGCASSKQIADEGDTSGAPSTTDPVCTDDDIAVVFRLDYLTLELLGYRVLLSGGTEITQSDALAIAIEELGESVGDDSGVFSLSSEDGSSPFAIVPDSAEAGDVLVAIYPPSDFGATVLVDRRGGVPIFLATTVWAGEGDILYPSDYLGPESLETVGETAPPPATLLQVGQTTGSDCSVWIPPQDATEEEHEVTCTTGAQALETLRSTKLLDELAACGSYDVLALMYSRSVGMTNYTTSEWVVVITGKGTQAQVDELLEPVSPPNTACKPALTPGADDGKVLAAYMVCPLSDSASPHPYFMMDPTIQYGATLYENGTLLFHDPSGSTGPDSWFTSVVSAEPWCAIMDQLDLEGLAAEAAAHLDISDASSARETFVYLEVDGQTYEVGIHGNPWQDVDEIADLELEIPNTLALVMGLQGLVTSAMEPYRPEQIALAGSIVDDPGICALHAGQWPFPDIDLAFFGGDAADGGPRLLFFDGAEQESLESWWDEQNGWEGQSLCVESGGLEYIVYLLAMPPGGYEANPFPACFAEPL